MIGGSDSKQGSYTPYTGVGAVRLHKVNPTKKEYKDIVGNEPPFELDYSKRKGFSEDNVRPLVFVYERLIDNTFGMFTIYLSDAAITTKKGDKFKFVDALGRISYYLDDVKNISPKFEFLADNSRKLFRGEDSLCMLIQQLTRYSPKSEDANFMADLKKVGANYSTLFKGDVKGLNKILDHFLEKDFGICLLFTVKEKEGKQIQKVSTQDNHFFYTVDVGEGPIVPTNAIRYFNALHEDQMKQGYPLSKDFYTINLQPFDKKDCLNYKEAPDYDDNLEGYDNEPGEEEDDNFEFDSSGTDDIDEFI